MCSGIRRAMDSLKAVQRHLMLQQRWVKLCCVAVVLVTLLALLLGAVGNDSAQIRATGMGAFTEEDVSKHKLGNHVSASNSTTNTLSIWSLFGGFFKSSGPCIDSMRYFMCLTMCQLSDQVPGSMMEAIILKYRCTHESGSPCRWTG